MVSVQQERVTGGTTTGCERPSLGAIWRALATVADPEIPVVSIIDLGIVRDVQWDVHDPQRLVVRLTPTYSGCPATDLIAAAVQDAVREAGVPSVSIETVLSPPWSTAFLSPEAQRTLRAYGIAPPGSAVRARAPVVDVTGVSPLRRPGVVVPCPRCGSEQTTLVAQYGSTACKAHYRCETCREPFDFFKPL